MKKLIYTRDDGFMNILSPCDDNNLLDKMSEYTKEQFTNNIIQQGLSENDHDVHQSQLKLQWIKNVVDWPNLTPQEINDYHACYTYPNSTKVRWVDDSMFPIDITLRPAWCDVTNSLGIDIDCQKAKDTQLNLMRQQIAPMLSQLDTQQLIALGKKDQVAADAVEAKKQILRDATNPLIALDCSGQINNDSLILQIKTLGIVPNVGI